MTRPKAGVQHTRQIILVRNVYTREQHYVCSRCYEDGDLVKDKFGDCEVVAGATYHGPNYVGCELRD